MVAGTAPAQSAFIKVGPEVVYDAGNQCSVPRWKVADFNADGRPDFALGVTPVSSYRAGGVPKPLMLWIAQPDGSYREQASQLFSGPVTSAYLYADVLVADFNNDGRPDVFVPDGGVDIYDANGVPTGPWLGATPRLALSTPTGYVDASAMFSGLPPTFAHTAAVADIERNGSPDIYVGSISAGSQSKLPYLLVNNGSGSFTYSQSRLPAIVAGARYGIRTRTIDASTRYVAAEAFTGSLFVDVDRDGYPDLVVLPGDATPSGLVLLNDGTGDFSRRPPIELPPGRYGGGWLVERRNPDGSVVNPEPRAPGPATVNLDAKAVDLNGDGYPDLVILQTVTENSPDYVFYRGGRVQILINQGGRGFVDETAARGAPGFDTAVDHDAYHATLGVVDLNGDGFPDLVATRVVDNYTPDVFLNDGTGKFTRSTLEGIPADGIYVVIAGGFQQSTRIVNVRFRNRLDANRSLICTLAVQTYERLTPVATTTNYQGLWWAAPATSESGWGLNVAHQGDTVFATWFTYDLAGKAWWLSMTANKTVDKTYTGTLIQTGGPAFSSVPFDPTRVTRMTVGAGTLRFTDEDNGTFAYTVNGTTQTKAITRQLFGPAPTCSFGASPNLLALATNYQDLWWVAAGAESGWGINLTHQGDNIFATWFTYDVDGTPLWLSATAAKQMSGVYSGQLIRTAGPAFNASPFSPAAVTRNIVGAATLNFMHGNAATLAYTVNGVSQAKNITRQLFAPAGTYCQ